MRIVHESYGHDRSSFVTLDYAPEHLRSWSLEYRDFQLFMKRLRRKAAGSVRFFVAGEYGARFRRPHWHAILFGYWPQDAERWQNGTYRSSTLEAVWGQGNCVIGDVTPQSAAYVAGYTLSKLGAADLEDLVDPSTGEVRSRRREMVNMSRRPGIGAGFIERFQGDVFPADRCIVEGRAWRVPRYYADRLARSDPNMREEVQAQREERAQLRADDGTPERLAVREEYAQARHEHYSERNH